MLQDSPVGPFELPATRGLHPGTSAVVCLLSTRRNSRLRPHVRHGLLGRAGERGRNRWLVFAWKAPPRGL